MTGVRIRFASQLDSSRVSEDVTSPVGTYVVHLDVRTVVAGGAEQPATTGLDPSYPNPFNPVTHIPYRLEQSAVVRLTVHNVLGQPVRRLVHERRPAGAHQATWDGRDDQGAGMGTGVYLVRLSTPSFSQTRKLLLLDGAGGALPIRPALATAHKSMQQGLPYTVSIEGPGIAPFTRRVTIRADTTLDFQVERTGAATDLPFETAWRFHQPIRIVENAGTGAHRFPVELAFDTRQLVRAGQLQADGADLRLTLAGREVPFQTEDLNTERTRLTFLVDLQPGQERADAVLHYGNPAASPASYAGDWGSIRPSRDGFENEPLRVLYGLKPGADGVLRGSQTVFFDKAHDEDQFGGEKIPDSWAQSRNDVTYWGPPQGVAPTFSVEVDGPVYKRMRFFSAWQRVDGDRRVYNLSQRVTFYRDSPFLREDYDNIAGPVVDTAVPGGTRLRDGERNFDFVVYNLDPALIAWDGIGAEKDRRGGFHANRALARNDPRYRFLGDHLYRGGLILGVVNVHNGRGIASMARDVQRADLVEWPREQAGYALFPSPTRRRLTRFLYLVEHGAEELIARGRTLADPPTAQLEDDGEDWGRIDAGPDPESRWSDLVVTLENSHLRVVYRAGVDVRDLVTPIRELTIRSTGQSQGYRLDGANNRGALADAAVWADGDDVKTARLTWDGNFGGRGTYVSEISIFRDRPWVQIDYVANPDHHIFDVRATPGGGAKGDYEIHGAQAWQAARGDLDDAEVPDELYPIASLVYLAPQWGPSPLGYEGWLILGLYNPDNGQGYGRVVPAAVMTRIKLLWGQGFEFFPYYVRPGVYAPWQPFTSYLFVTTQGADGILTRGRAIADWANTRKP